MQIAGELLDHPVFDRNGREMGRVDGIEAEWSAGEPPRLTAILIGPAALVERVTIFRRWLPLLARVIPPIARCIRIPIGQVRSADDRVQVDDAIGDTGADAVERQVRRSIAAIPGARL